jgi:hypothetical protein
MSISLKRLMCIAVFALFCLGLCRAAMFRFQEKEDAIRKSCREQLQKLGLTFGAAKAKYFTPEIHMVSGGCLMPGGTADVVIKGKFAPETSFVFENDDLEVVKEALAGSEYRATLKAAAGIGPMTASVAAITPVTGLTVRRDNAASVGGNYEWTIAAANGWKIVARSNAVKACGDRPSAGESYEVAFYRQGESAPFEKRAGTLHYSMYERTNYRLSISQDDPAAKAGMEDFTTLMQKMTDPKLTPAQREELMKSLQKAQEQMQANMSKMTDPAYLKAQQAKRLEFGCERIDMEVQASAFKGEMRCSEKLGTRIALTGTMRPLSR